MKETVISYGQMCRNERVKTLERGFNYRLAESYSVLLLSCHSSAVYQNLITSDGSVVVCEGHDVRKNMLQLDPKEYDQPRVLKSGELSQNGLFAKAVDDYLAGTRQPEVVRVYEKLSFGMWRDKGFYRLTEYSYIPSGSRRVFRFRLERIEKQQSFLVGLGAEQPKPAPLA
jgi:hypothetical protein